MAKGFLELMPADAVARVCSRFGPTGRSELIDLANAPGRVCAVPLAAPEDLPPFDRSLMDGFAVRSSEAASARETSPVFFEVIGQVEMGERTGLRVGPGQAVAVPTGAMLPAESDCVVMVEHTRPLGDSRIEVTRAAAPGQHVLHQSEDLAAGDDLLPAGRRICDLDLGALAASGVARITVHAQPRVAILSTGDELVGPERTPSDGQVRDTNAVTLAAQVTRAGGIPWFAGRIVDEFDQLLEAADRARQDADLLLLSGGSSVGMRDHTARVLEQLAGTGLLIEGIAIAPGKPTLLADLDGVPAFGLPGHPVSSFVVFHVVVAPLLRRLAGEYSERRPHVRIGTLTANVPASPGRETWQRVQLIDGPDDIRVAPVPGTSAVYASLLASDGLLRIPADQEGWAKGERVEVEVLR